MFLLPSTARLDFPLKAVLDCFVGFPLAMFFPLKAGVVFGRRVGFGRGFGSGRGFGFTILQTPQLLRHCFNMYLGFLVHSPILYQYGQCWLSSVQPKMIIWSLK